MNALFQPGPNRTVRRKAVPSRYAASAKGPQRAARKRHGYVVRCSSRLDTSSWGRKTLSSPCQVFRAWISKPSVTASSRFKFVDDPKHTMYAQAVVGSDLTEQTVAGQQDARVNVCGDVAKAVIGGKARMALLEREGLTNFGGGVRSCVTTPATSSCFHCSVEKSRTSVSRTGSGTTNRYGRLQSTSRRPPLRKSIRQEASLTITHVHCIVGPPIHRSTGVKGLVEKRSGAHGRDQPFADSARDKAFETTRLFEVRESVVRAEGFRFLPAPGAGERCEGALDAGGRQDSDIPEAV